MSSIKKTISKGLSKKKINRVDNLELTDYIQHMMVRFSEISYDVDQNNIKLIRNRGWAKEGARYFLAKKIDRKIEIRVILEKYNSDDNSIIQDDLIVEVSEKLNELI